LIQSKFHFRLLIHKRELIVDARDAGAAAAQESGKRVEEGDGNLHKLVANYDFFCSATMLTTKMISEITENHSEISGCANSCNQFISSRSCDEP